MFRARQILYSASKPTFRACEVMESYYEHEDSG